MKPCFHHWLPCAIEGYSFCHMCNSFKSECPSDPHHLYRNNYWSHARGHSTLREQVFNVDGHEENSLTKNAFVLNLIDPPGYSAVLEIGCAPGVLLGSLKSKGFGKVVGIEVDSDHEEDIRDISGLGRCDACELWFGVFPKSTRSMKDGRFSCVIGLDVFEHSPDPEGFLAECARLMVPNAQLILMLPLALSDMPERMFCPEEHVFLHSKTHMTQLLYAAGFGQVDVARWCPGHEVVTARKL